MKKLCILSLMIGIGIGMIITATVHELVDSQEQIVPEAVEQEPAEGIEKALGEIKGVMAQGNVSPQEEIHTDTNPHEEENSNEVAEKNESTSFNIETLRDEEENEWVEVSILPGMTTQDIGELLLEKDLVQDVDAFIKLAYERQVTKKFIAGTTLIPLGSTVEEVIEILISIR